MQGKCSPPVLMLYYGVALRGGHSDMAAKQRRGERQRGAWGQRGILFERDPLKQRLSTFSLPPQGAQHKRAKAKAKAKAIFYFTRPRGRGLADWRRNTGPTISPFWKLLLCDERAIPHLATRHEKESLAVRLRLELRLLPASNTPPVPLPLLAIIAINTIVSITVIITQA